MDSFRKVRFVKIFAVIILIAVFSAFITGGYSTWTFYDGISYDLEASGSVHDDIKENTYPSADGLFVKLFAENPTAKDSDGWVIHTDESQPPIYAQTGIVSGTKISSCFSELFGGDTTALVQALNGKTEAQICNRLMGYTVATIKVTNGTPTYELASDFEITRNHILYIKVEGV